MNSDFYKSTSWCSYFSVILIRLLQFWDYTAIVKQINSAHVWLDRYTEYLFYIYINFDTPIIKLPLTGPNSRLFLSAHTKRTGSGPWREILWIWQKWIRIADGTFKATICSYSKQSLASGFCPSHSRDWWCSWGWTFIYYGLLFYALFRPKCQLFT